MKSRSEAKSVRRFQRPRSFAALGMMFLFAVWVAVVPASPAAATEYPTWSQVAAARASETAAKMLIAQIRTEIQTLQSQTEQTAALAQTQGAAYEAADQNFQEAAFAAVKLKGQADAATALATESRAKAGRIVAQLARSGGQNVSLSLFANGKSADHLLSQLGLATKVTELAGATYARATRDRNSAQSLTAQADRAAKSREQLRAVASQAMDSARIASEAADSAVAERTQNEADLQAQLAVLIEKRSATEIDYAAGEAARAAAVTRAAGAAGAAGKVSSSGWASPTSGRLVSLYGYRIHPVYKTYRLHNGDDLAGGCNIPIYAATGGRVIFSGLNGGYGNFILLDHGSGIESDYAHIVDGGRLVSDGQIVVAGQMIARTGSTGASTGCHLHFEIRSGGVALDPFPFMRERGITLG